MQQADGPAVTELTGIGCYGCRPLLQWRKNGGAAAELGVAARGDRLCPQGRGTTAILACQAAQSVSWLSVSGGSCEVGRSGRVR